MAPIQSLWDGDKDTIERCLRPWTEIRSVFTCGSLFVRVPNGDIREIRNSERFQENDEEENMTSIMCKIDDKHVPLYRVMWISDLPHFCGHEDCEREGQYEVRLEQDESIWTDRDDRDRLMDALQQWQGGLGLTDDWN